MQHPDRRGLWRLESDRVTSPLRMTRGARWSVAIWFTVNAVLFVLELLVR